MTELQPNKYIVVRREGDRTTGSRSQGTVRLPKGGSIEITNQVVVAPPVEPPPPPPPSGFPATGRRPYTDDSPWNLPIVNPVVHPQSAAWIAGIPTAAQPVLRSDPTQYAYPVYHGPTGAPRDLICSGKASIQNLDGTRTDPTNKRIPGFRGTGLPASPGTDGQIIIIDPANGDEWDVWQFDGVERCTNATLYKGGMYRSGTTSPVTYWSRGAGVPYHAGLIRRWEVDAEKIEHALAFAYHSCSPAFVWPGTKSDGKNAAGIPQGSLIQLDPAFDVMALTDPVTRMIALALQKYGARVIDSSGSVKIVPESHLTAAWGSLLTSKTVNPIPISRLRVLL